jgi:hypothetical protein
VLLRVGQQGMCENIPDTSMHALYISPTHHDLYHLSTLKGTPKASRLFPRGSVKVTTSGYHQITTSKQVLGAATATMVDRCYANCAIDMLAMTPSGIIVRKNPQTLRTECAKACICIGASYIMHHDVCQRWRPSHLGSPSERIACDHLIAALGHHMDMYVNKSTSIFFVWLQVIDAFFGGSVPRLIECVGRVSVPLRLGSLVRYIYIRIPSDLAP